MSWSKSGKKRWWSKRVTIVPKGLRKTTKTSVNTVGVPVDVRTEHISNTNLDPYLCTNLCRETGNGTSNHILFLKVMYACM
jgi:hypothetical protein